MRTVDAVFLDPLAQRDLRASQGRSEKMVHRENKVAKASVALLADLVYRATSAIRAAEDLTARGALTERRAKRAHWDSPAYRELEASRANRAARA